VWRHLHLPLPRRTTGTLGSLLGSLRRTASVCAYWRRCDAVQLRLAAMMLLLDSDLFLRLFSLQFWLRFTNFCLPHSVTVGNGNDLYFGVTANGSPAETGIY